MFGHVPTGKRGRANTTKVRQAEENLRKALEMQRDVNSRKSISNASGIPYVNYAQEKRNANAAIEKATRALENATK
jgi:hypothetical protein